MNKAFSIDNLYDDLKDNIEFDEDVEALFKILKKTLKDDQEKGIEEWIYIMKRYDFQQLQKDINVFPLTNDFLLELTKIKSLIDTVELINRLPLINQKIVRNHFFNVFCTASGINQYFSENSFKKQEREILCDIKYILDDKLIKDKMTFNKTIFLKKIIIAYLSTPSPNMNFLLEISDLPETKKERAILKSLLIDYIFK